jgi:hypothetical protein
MHVVCWCLVLVLFNDLYLWRMEAIQYCVPLFFVSNLYDFSFYWNLTKSVATETTADNVTIGNH